MYTIGVLYRRNQAVKVKYEVRHFYLRLQLNRKEFWYTLGPTQHKFSAANCMSEGLSESLKPI